jgi:hypothetical protein
MDEILESRELNERTYFESPGPLALDKIRSILGAPPVLSTENAEAYYAMQQHYMEALEPKDFLLQMLVQDLMDADWESRRYKRHKAWAIERRDRMWRELQARHSEIAQQRKSAKENKEKPETESERLFQLELETDRLGINSIALVDGLQKPSRDADLSRAMEEAISYYERLERLEKDSLAKRVVILEQIRLYDEVLFLKGRRAYDVVDDKTAKLLRLP